MKYKNSLVTISAVSLCLGFIVGSAALPWATTASADSAIQMDKGTPNWCTDIQADVDGVSHAFKGCAETKELCETGRGMARDYSSVIGITAITSCSKR